MRTLYNRLIHLLWWFRHIGWRCDDKYIVTEHGARNPSYPDYVTPRHYCIKCGREYVKGRVYPFCPVPPPPVKEKLD